MLTQIALANNNQISTGNGSKITLKKRSNSESKAQENDLDDDFSCDTSQYSAFDESERSSDLFNPNDSNVTKNSQLTNSNEK